MLAAVSLFAFSLFEVFTPRRQCMRFEPDIVWTHFAADLLTAMAYFSIPFALLVLIRKRKDLTFNWMVMLFALFIVLCGTTHLFSILALWMPVYRLDGYVKLATGVVSIFTAVLLWRLIPQALAFPSMEVLQRSNLRLEAEVTERKRAEEELAKLNAELEHRVRLRTTELESLVTSAPFGVAFFDKQHRYLRINQTLATTNGITLVEHLGRPIADLLPQTAPSVEPVIDRVFATGSAIGNLEITGETPREPGARKHWLTGFYPVRDAQGTVESVGVWVVDITDRKTIEEALRESELFYRQTIESIPGMVFTCRPDGSSDYVSDQWIEFTGRPGDSLLGKGWLKSLHPQDRARAYDAWIAAVQERGEYHLEYRVRAADGSYRWFKVRGRAICDTSGNVVRWFGTAVNVDDLKRAEEALREQDQRKDEFLATLAHELRNPLAPMRNGLEILRRTSDANHTAKAREMMGRQLDHLVDLVDDLLDISRVSRGKITLRREVVSLTDAVEGALEACRHAIDSKCHALEFHRPDQPLFVEGDRTRLVQVVTNLLTNAAKYSDANGRVTIRLSRVGHEAALSVSDQGVGIEADVLPTLWDMFTQVRDTLDKAQGGLGIGLSLVKKLVEMHGGSVSAESLGLGLGSTFTVRLPALRPPMDHTIFDHEASPGASSESSCGSTTQETPCATLSAKKSESQESYSQDTCDSSNGASSDKGPSDCRVLIIDDNADGAESLAMMLQMLGHETQIAADGPAGLVTANTFQPDVVFCDIGLPGMDGYEVSRQFRRTFPNSNMMLVALTGWGSEDDKRKSREAGFDYHLTKPVDLAAVEACLERQGCHHH